MATKKTTEETVEAVETKEKPAEKTVEKKTAPKGKKVEQASEEIVKPKKPAAAKPPKAVKEESLGAVPEASSEVAEKKKESATVKAVKPKAASTAVKAEATPVKDSEKTVPAKKPAAEPVKKETKDDKADATATEKPAKKTKETKPSETRPELPRLKRKYLDEVVPAMREKFKYRNVMEVPKLEKINISMGLGAEKDNAKGIETAVEQLGLIVGQKAVIVKAKKSVANFKVRAGMNIGAKVTLRGDRMHYFADKLMNIVLPRVRDFRGVSENAFDGRGNYALGLKEQLIFPEINYDDVDKVRGMNVVFVTSAKTDEEAKALLSMLGMPFAQG